MKNLTRLTNSKGEESATRPILALCRCGGSNLKPYCDGTHARIGFTSAKSPDRAEDRLDEYAGDGKGEPFVTAGGADAETIISIVRQCPSGALGYVRDGVAYTGELRDPEIYVAANASYYVRGGIELEGEAMNHGALRAHYALCRCGHSKNKPFCDGTHWWIGFSDPDN